jgi:membrane-anchored protein YejM (alkaline phosphatase superfamily)
MCERMAAGAQAGTPFFLSLHYTAPHWPWETRDDEALAQDEGQPLSPARRQHPHLSAHDSPHGRRHWPVMAGAAHGLADNTLVVFTSDNGGERFSDNWPLVGGKMDLTEGGIRVPWIAHWPAVIALRWQRQQQACMTMDWSATMLDAAGAHWPIRRTRWTACR